MFLIEFVDFLDLTFCCFLHCILYSDSRHGWSLLSLYNVYFLYSFVWLLKLGSTNV